MLSQYTRNIGTLYLMFALLSGLLSTAFSILSKLELLGPGVQFIADNQLYYSVITAYAISMIIFMVMPDIIWGVGKLLFSPLFKIYVKHCVNLICGSLILRLIVLLTANVVSYALLCHPYIVSISISACILGFHIHKMFTRGSFGSSFSYAKKLILNLGFLYAFWLVFFIYTGLDLSAYLLMDGAEGNGGSENGPDNGGTNNQVPEGGQGGGGPVSWPWGFPHVTDEYSDSQENANALNEDTQRIGACSHTSLFPFPDQSNDAIENQMCDLNKTPLSNGEFLGHNAFVGGLSPTQCSECFGVFCRDCTNTNYNSDTGSPLQDTSPHENRVDGENGNGVSSENGNGVGDVNDDNN